MKAFFSLDSLIGLFLSLILSSLLLTSFYQSHSLLYKYQLAEDLAEVGVNQNNFRFLLKKFCEGDVFSRESLVAEYSKIISFLGDYCLVIRAGKNELEVNCISSGIKSEITVERTLFLENTFVRVFFSLRD